MRLPQIKSWRRLLLLTLGAISIGWLAEGWLEIALAFLGFLCLYSAAYEKGKIDQRKLEDEVLFDPDSQTVNDEVK